MPPTPHIHLGQTGHPASGKRTKLSYPHESTQPQEVGALVDVGHSRLASLGGSPILDSTASVSESSRLGVLSGTAHRHDKVVSILERSLDGETFG